MTIIFLNSVANLNNEYYFPISFANLNNESYFPISVANLNNESYFPNSVANPGLQSSTCFEYISFPYNALGKCILNNAAALIESFVSRTVVFATYDELWKTRTGSPLGARTWNGTSSSTLCTRVHQKGLSLRFASPVSHSGVQNEPLLSFV